MKLTISCLYTKNVGIEPGKDVKYVISIIAVSISSFATVASLFLGRALIDFWLVPILNHPFVKSKFDSVIPASLGAIAIPKFLSNRK